MWWLGISGHMQQLWWNRQGEVATEEDLIREDKVLKVLRRDNRGDNRVQFGYVYFDDGSRVAYAPGTAKDLIGFPGLFIPRDSWGELRTEHLRLASDYLAQKGVDLNPTPELASVE